MRHAVSLLLVAAVGVLLPLLCVPDALAPPGHGWHLLVERDAAHAHRGELANGAATLRRVASHDHMASARSPRSVAVSSIATDARGGPQAYGVADVAAPQDSPRHALTRSNAPGPSADVVGRAWILSEDLSPPPRVLSLA